MIIRFVKMTFTADSVEVFLEHFDKNKQQIKDFEGCEYLQVLRDKDNPNIIFSHSWWKSEEDLNNYRKSEFFGGVWKRSKQLFAAKPEAWSLDVLHNLT
ncbi:MAG: antibiotic biosynthesis monooxygenase [Aureispira sp.]|nr:antibiotic biosynthesis monooxygenase [Aureispira sp.]